MRLKDARDKKRMTLMQLSREAGIAQGYLSELETGKKKNPSVKTAKKIAAVLGFDWTLFFEDERPGIKGGKRDAKDSNSCNV